MSLRPCVTYLACLLVAVAMSFAAVGAFGGHPVLAAERTAQTHPCPGYCPTTAATPRTAGGAVPSSMPTTGGADGHAASGPSVAIEALALAAIGGGLLARRLRR